MFNFRSPPFHVAYDLTCALGLGLISLALFFATSAICGISLPLAQLIALPFVVLICFRLRLCGVGVPKALIIISTCGALLAAWYSYLGQGSIGGRFIVARLIDDSDEAKSSILREQINDSAKRLFGLSATRYHSVISSYEDVAKAFETNAFAKVIVWGKENNFFASFPPQESTARMLPISQKILGAKDLFIIKGIPIVKLISPIDQDVPRFLGDLFNAISVGESLTAVEPEKEMAFAGAGWTPRRGVPVTYAGLPWLWLANMKIERFIGDPKGDPSDLNCAINSYNRGLRLVRSEENPELAAALQNNLGVAFYILGMQEFDKKLQKAARIKLSRSIGLLKQKNPFNTQYFAGHVAEKNLSILRNKNKQRYFYAS